MVLKGGWSKMMKKIFSILLIVVVVGLLSPTQTADADSTWSAKYWDNIELEGDPVLEEDVDDIDFDWGDDGPDDDLTDEFSARWKRKLYFSAGVYRFTATMDDGMRVWVDDALIIDSWNDSQAHTVSADISLTAGDHTVKVEYYEKSGGAIAKLNWTTVSGYAGLWHGEFFNNTTLSGSPVHVRDDGAIDFYWGGSPGDGVWADEFSARWTGTLSLDPGTYRFSVTTDDGARLWVNNQLLVDEWYEQESTTYEAEISIANSSVPVQLEYFDHGGLAIIALSWTKVATPATIPEPPVITDWQAEYFNNTGLTGSPAIVRNDAAIDFIWGSSSPLPNVVDADHFSVRWTQTVNLSAGTYVFTAVTDDGVRLWVNNQQVIDSWEIQSTTTHNGAITVPGGATTIVMEYFEYTGLAEARLSWANSNAIAAASSISPAPAIPSSTGTPTSATMSGAQYLTVRSEPSLEGEAIAYLSNGQAVTLLARDPFTIWIQVRLANGTIGWVSGRFLTPDAPLGNLPVNYMQ